MKKRSKRYREVAKLINGKEFSLEDALALLKKTASAKFDETVEVSVRLGVDPRHADQVVRGTVSLPHGLGKEVRVLVVAKGEKETEAKEAGADYAGYDEYLEKIQSGWLEFDVLVATPDAMRDLGKLGRVLGPRGLMPNPKSGTVTTDIFTTVKEIKAGKIDFRVDKTGIVHTGVGKASFEVDKLRDNIKTLMQVILRLKPATAKGTYLKSICVSNTMGPGIRIVTNPLEFQD
ncbi:MAG: 50S ribosomal protein L1 [Calditrichaeota bacterium]|nr:50S ribosomal protein L1 [Calditrichota bacterium]MCB0291250.1 50S ribosomal protein L1 [Calditrichota bacterium]MCB0302696.1 50S ribosomal protein L1 [Calditrichota bacterium]MCB0311932.1 50S ribosomal protein L1 [Calditrichota bacterium]MCB9087202.1 50S ribosomal protein L1 [Calditrichia bacterium]